MNRPRLHLFVIAIFVAALGFALVACGDTEGPLPAPPADADAGDVGADVGADVADAADAVANVMPDSTFRMTAVTIIRPRGVGGILQSLINNDIDANALHVLVQMKNFAGEWPTTFELTGNAGATTGSEGEYTWYPGVEIGFASAEIDADGFFAGTETLSIIFPALEPGATEPIQIPVSELSLEGELYQDEGEWLISGTLDGAILASSIEGMIVDLGEPQPLADLLGGSGSMDYPPGAEGEALTGWALVGDIEAEQVMFVERE